MALAFFTLMTWPVRFFLRWLLGRKALGKAKVKRVVILGLDGQDPELTERWMAEGLLPNFSRLRENGSYTRLRTSMLSESPVAWSSFQTGCNPGRHKIYDFLVPNRKSHLPELSSAQIEPPTRMLKIGRYRIPLGGAVIRQGRKSQPFWNILGQHGIFSAILRVPITFPPEKFRGVLLSAMCVPDLKGSQGTYFFYTTDPTDKRSLSSGIQLPLAEKNGWIEGALSGPPNSLLRDGPEMTLPFRMRRKGDGEVELLLEKKKHLLKKGQYSPWITVNFKPGFGMKVRGLCKFYVIETSPHLQLYVPPIQIDPAKPALPISHPFSYAVYLAKTQAPYATLGVAEDTSALNEGVIGEQAFLDQAWEIHAERERQYFDAIAKVRQGLVCCVFDITDRLQHMFFRCIDDRHPANAGREVDKYRDVLKDMYVEMDRLVGRTLAALDDDSLLFVMSDHGFKSFRRGVNLNAWLWQNGLLAMKEGASPQTDMLQAVDWSHTKAYAVGFGGIYLNLKGREARGIVEPGEESESVRARIIEGLKALYDPKENVHPVKEVYDTREAYKGPYVAEAPDLIAGFTPGHRVSWANVTGGLSEEIFEDNTRPWSGDHNMNPADVPGILFSNRTLANGDAHIMDLAPTVLDLFGVPAPAYMDGRSLLKDSPLPSPPMNETITPVAADR